VTFILNVLHKDMSILAADQRAVAEWPSFGFPSRGKAVCHDAKKITINSTFVLAMGTSGYSEHNSYINDVARSESVKDGLSIIRSHMESFLQVDDLASLIKSASPFENECIATFYDEDTNTFFTNEFGFNEFSNRTRLHKASDEVKILCAGSGRKNFDADSAKDEVQLLVDSKDNLQLEENIVSWMKSAFRLVSDQNEGCGPDPIFAVATRIRHEFHISDRR